MKNKIMKEAQLPWSGRIGRLAKILADKTDIPTVKKIMCKHQEYQNTSNYAKKAEWIREVMARMQNILDIELCLEIMESCGLKCCGKTTREHARKAKQESKDIQDFIQRLNKIGIGGGRLQLKDKNTIVGGYDKCYCGQVKKTKTPFPDKTYCQCSVGWYKQLFGSALNKEVKVELIQSIISGAKTCEFIIHI